VLFGILACTMTLKHRYLIWVAVSICATVMGKLFFVDFMLGAFLAAYRYSRGSNPHALNAGMTWIIFIICLIMGAASPGWLIYLNPALTFTSWQHHLITHSTAFGFVILVALSGSFSRFITWKPLLWLGERSFSLYAVHALLLATVGYSVTVTLIENGLGKGPACFLGLISYVIASLIAADILTRWIDKPSMVFANKAGQWLKGSAAQTKATREDA